LSGTLVVMQPTVLPWPGYFNLMCNADDFVFHDDVLLSRPSWQTRNRLLFAGKAEWVSLPTMHVGDDQRISETKVIMDKKWKDMLRRRVSQNYSRHPHFREAAEIIEILLDHTDDCLSSRTETCIRYIAGKLGLHPRIHRSSDLRIDGHRSDRLIAFCRYFNADIYLSPVGSADYLAADSFAEHAPSRLAFQEYAPQPYPQANCPEFVSHLSIVDLVANVGWESARAYVISGSL